jgi:acetyl-CoA C-acetyltransferase
MQDVVIAGIGQTAVGEHWDISLREIALFAIETARKDVVGLKPQALYIGNMLAPVLSRQSHLGSLVADFAGMNGIEAIAVEAAGASGGVALRMGCLAVASGEVDVALVVGAEKLTEQTGSEVNAAIGTTTDSDYEAVHGLTQVAQAALLMRRYMHEFGVTAEDFAVFPMTAHQNGVSNENAMFRREIKLETYRKAGKVCDPINIFDVAPYADGAAAVVLTRQELIPPRFPHQLVRILGSSVVTDTLALHDRPVPLVLNASRLSIERACAQAGIEVNEVDFFELFDAFSIYAALSLEAAGVADRGLGCSWAKNEDIRLNGRLPISTFGGLKARGNPGGATGVYQIVEAVMQLRGQAGDNQVPSARTALVQSLGGPASTAATHVLQGVD